MDIAQVKAQHEKGMAQLGALLSQKESVDEQVKNLKSQLLQLEAIMKYAESQPVAKEAEVVG